jgi:hypothetical protein
MPISLNWPVLARNHRPTTETIATEWISGPVNFFSIELTAVKRHGLTTLDPK